MSDQMRHFDNLNCIAVFVPMSDERKDMLRQAASELARLRLTPEERAAIDAALGWCDDRDAKTITTLRSLLERLG